MRVLVLHDCDCGGVEDAQDAPGGLQVDGGGPDGFGGEELRGKKGQI